MATRKKKKIYKRAPVSNPTLMTWKKLNKDLPEMSEEQCLELLKEELAGRNRKSFLSRIHHRLSRIRTIKEREALGLD